MPEIRFFRGKKEIKPGSRTKFNVDSASKTGTITINNTNLRDEDKYSIQLISNTNTVSDDANFNIYVKGIVTSTIFNLVKLFQDGGNVVKNFWQ